MPASGEIVAYRDEVRAAAQEAWRAIENLRDYVLAVKSCLGAASASGALPIAEDHANITRKLADVDATVAQLLALVAQRQPGEGQATS